MICALCTAAPKAPLKGEAHAVALHPRLDRRDQDIPRDDAVLGGEAGLEVVRVQNLTAGWEFVVSGYGHLSNIQSAEIVRRLNPPHLHTLFLSHISQENNTPSLAIRAFEDMRDKYEIRVMSRNEASDVWAVTTERARCLPNAIEIPKRLDRVPLPIPNSTL